MRRGGTNIGRIGGKKAAKARAGNNAATRKRLGRWVSKSRRRALRDTTLVERSWEEDTSE